MVETVGEGSDRVESKVGFERTVAFSDGVFAIAITLIVLSIDVPDVTDPSNLGHELSKLDLDFLAYFIGFAVIGIYWVEHHRFFDSLARFSSAMLWLNLLFLSMIVLLPFSTAVLGEYGDEPLGVAVYALNVTAVSLAATLMALLAVHARLLRPDAQERSRDLLVGTLMPAIVFAASIPVAYADFSDATAVARWMWLLLAILPRLFERFGWLHRRHA